MLLYYLLLIPLPHPSKRSSHVNNSKLQTQQIFWRGWEGNVYNYCKKDYINSQGTLCSTCRLLFPMALGSDSGSSPPHNVASRSHSDKTHGRTSLDNWSDRRRDLYLTTHNILERQTSILQWDSKPESQQADGHWDRQMFYREENSNPVLLRNIIWIKPGFHVFLRASIRFSWI